LGIGKRRKETGEGRPEKGNGKTENGVEAGLAPAPQIKNKKLDLLWEWIR